VPARTSAIGEIGEVAATIAALTGPGSAAR
jgi:hypothetical protein